MKCLENAFLDYFLNHGIMVEQLGIVEEESELKLVFVPRSQETMSVFGFRKEKCIGLEIDVIVKSIIEPMLPRLKEKFA